MNIEKSKERWKEGVKTNLVKIFIFIRHYSYDNVRSDIISTVFSSVLVTYTLMLLDDSL